MSMHIAVVTSISDDEKSGRIRASLPDLGNEEYPVPFDPVLPPGFHLLPKVGDQVAVFLPAGEDLTTFPEYAFWLAAVRDRDSNPVPDEFKDSYEKQTGYKTKEGLLLVFDDDKKLVRLQTPGGHKVTLEDGSSPSVKIEHSGGATASLGADGNATIRVGAGKQILLDDGGGGAEALVKKSEFSTWVAATALHTHGGVTVGAGSTGAAVGFTDTTTGTTVVRGK